LRSHGRLSRHFYFRRLWTGFAALALTLLLPGLLREHKERTLSHSERPFAKASSGGRSCSMAATE
jgi:hypothetical protein